MRKTLQQQQQHQQQQPQQQVQQPLKPKVDAQQLIGVTKMQAISDSERLRIEHPLRLA